MNLAAASAQHSFYLILMYTCNQSAHPGIRHLHKWKESKKWKSCLPLGDSFSCMDNEDVERSMEMVYSHVLTRCWLEVRKLWLNFIMYSTSTMLNKPKISFFRDKYQPECGNLSHIHGLLALQRGDMENTEFVRFVCSLQKNSVMDLVSSKEVDGLVQKRLIRDD